MIKIPEDVAYILNTLEAHGYEAYVVGGCVRDSLMGNTPKDWDITTSAKPEQFKPLFQKTFDTGIKHGTITVVLNKCNYEVTTYRIDGDYEDSRHPSGVVFTTNLKEDLLRRDFTMNAIAFNPQGGLVDPFSGFTDIKLKLIRGVGNPEKRFTEDALRMMRAVRFSAQTGFSIEEQTYLALKKHSKLIRSISIERIRDEFIKLLLSDHVECLSMLMETGLIFHISEFWHHYLNKFSDKIVKFLTHTKQELIYRLSLFCFYMTTEEIIGFLTFLKIDNKTSKEIICLCRELKAPYPMGTIEIKEQLNAVGETLFDILYELKKTTAQVNNNVENLEKIRWIISEKNKMLSNKECIYINELNINGNELKALGIPSGKHMGVILKNLLYKIWEKPQYNTKNKLRQLAIDAWQEIRYND